MKIIFLALSLSLATFAAGAQTSSSQASTQSTSGSTNAGNNQGVTFNSNSSGTSTLRTVPSVAGSGFYGSFSSDSCMVSGGGGGAVVGFGLNVAIPVEDQKCSLRRNFERTMQAAASTKDPDRSRRLETAAIDILCQTDDRTKAALAAQGLCSNPNLATTDHRFVSPVAQGDQPAAQTSAQVAPVQPVASVVDPVMKAQSTALLSPPLRNPRKEKQALSDFFSPG